jgi:hypothetical protein
VQLESALELKTEIVRRIAAMRLPSTDALREAGSHVLRGSFLPGLAIGVSRRGSRDYRLALRVQVRGLESFVEQIRRWTSAEVDVRFVGTVSKRATLPTRPTRWYRARQRPLLTGCSLGLPAAGTGTLGGFVRSEEGALSILSNNHVLADEDRAPLGAPILQPGPVDGGREPEDEVARLACPVPISWSEGNRVDAAIATVGAGIECDTAALRGLGRLAGVADPDADVDLVEKLGRTTGRTRGQVTAVEVDNVVVAYDGGNVRFDGQIEIHGVQHRHFSTAGDSGSLIVTSPDRLAYALLFAGSDAADVTYANPIGTVLSELGCRLVT